MLRTFNMGIGLALIVPPFFAGAIVRRLEKAGERAWVIGEVRRGARDAAIIS